MIIIFLGPPGAGKGTQGKKIAEKIHLPHIVIGDIFRAIIKTSSKDAEVINSYVEQGKLIPDEIVNQIIKNFLSSSDYKKGYILDGYPRNLEQAKFFESFVKEKLKVIYLNVSDELLIKRILGRYSCKNCGKIYNDYFLKPKIDKICDVCKSNVFEYRKDDNEEVIKERINIFKTETYPLIQHYKNNDNFYMIDGNKNEQQIEDHIEKVLKIN
ncbi:adenylate kinase [Rickettsia endosymbiont of Gonocerus acuteangulatus]|uniref:adenylate kinase n=1 Tax=Rickettsia endosymbiont of Gonocerus acuteangulatus TaxID=3066266 RepID=UPI003132FFA9